VVGILVSGNRGELGFGFLDIIGTGHLAIYIFVFSKRQGFFCFKSLGALMYDAGLLDPAADNLKEFMADWTTCMGLLSS